MVDFIEATSGDHIPVSTKRHSVHVVLVRPKYSSNIGSTARAMANMDAQRLILIGSRCEINSRARQGAAGAQEKLNHVVSYSHWDDFYAHEGQGIRIAFTRREGKNRKVSEFKSYLESMTPEMEKNFISNDLYLVFGPEDNGLCVEDMAYVNAACSLPAFGDFLSLNLSQAVLLALYIFQNFKRESPAFRALELVAENEVPESEGDLTLKPFAELESHICFSQESDEIKPLSPLLFPDQTIKDWITAIGFNISARKASAYLTVRRLFLESLPSERDLFVLESILQQNIRKLKNKKKSFLNVEGPSGLQTENN